MSLKALVIDDDPHIRDAVSEILKSLGHSCDYADCVDTARICIETNEYAYYLLDLEIPVSIGRSFPRIQNGENLLEEIIRRSGTTRKPVIVMTAHGTDSPDLAVDIMKKGACDYVTKPFKSTGRTLDKSIREALGAAASEFTSPPQTEKHAFNAELNPPKKPDAFTGGEMVFYPDRVELCGVDICGARSKTRRKLLDALKMRRSDGSFAAFGGDALSRLAGIKSRDCCGPIRDLRGEIEKCWKAAKGFSISGDEVVLSGGIGYRLSEKLTVRDGEMTDFQSLKDITDTSNVPNVRKQDVRKVPNQNVRNADDDSDHRLTWILYQLKAGVKLKGTDVMRQFDCVDKTAYRMLGQLQDLGKIEFVGATRTGYYQLVQASVAEAKSGG